MKSMNTILDGMKTNAIVLALSAAVVMMSGCSESTPPIEPAEEDVITTVTIRAVLNGDTTEYVWEDIDGTGANPPNRIDTIRLVLGEFYPSSLLIENRSVTPVVDVMADIKELKNQHQFFYTVGGSIIAVAPIDYDDNGKFFGSMFRMAPAARGKGSLTISLSHFDKASDKNGTTPSDETDISVTFPIVVE